MSTYNIFPCRNKKNITTFWRNKHLILSSVHALILRISKLPINGAIYMYIEHGCISEVLNGLGYLLTELLNIAKKKKKKKKP